MLLDHRTVIDDLFLFISQISERNICPDAHRPADICHQGPHQGIPWRDGTIVHRQTLIRDQCRTVNGADGSGASAALAGTLGIERQFLSAGSVEVFPAYRTDDLLHRSDL